MQKEVYITEIKQQRVKILKASDWEGYNRNYPGPNWDLIEYVGIKDEDGQPIRRWAPKTLLATPRIDYPGQVKIVVNGK